MQTLPSCVSLFEVGPRDGLQNETSPVSTKVKVALINQLSKTGLTQIEAGSFVSPKWVPQMASSAAVFDAITRENGVRYSALVPNMKGYQAARNANAGEVAVFAAASESFSQQNINCSIKESIERFIPIIEAAREDQVLVRAYVSCVVGCPYDGDIAPRQVSELAKQLHQLGCYEISLGDTIGVGTPVRVSDMIKAVSDEVPVKQLALHCHDTYGQALANIYAALQLGVTTFDSSIAGLGGCPYAKGASGNVATEDVLYLLNGLGIETGVDLQALAETGHFISQKLGRANQSKVSQALSAAQPG